MNLLDEAQKWYSLCSKHHKDETIQVPKWLQELCNALLIQLNCGVPIRKWLNRNQWVWLEYLAFFELISWKYKKKKVKTMTSWLEMWHKNGVYLTQHWNSQNVFMGRCSRFTFHPDSWMRIEEYIEVKMLDIKFEKVQKNSYLFPFQWHSSKSQSLVTKRIFSGFKSVWVTRLSCINRTAWHNW